jgi:hypothetical protein
MSSRYPVSLLDVPMAFVPRGRNDLVHYLFDGRRVVFEVFTSTSQVPHDLRLLERAQAHARVAILLDEAVDARLAREYFRKCPDAFPFLWVSDILDPQQEAATAAKLATLLTAPGAETASPNDAEATSHKDNSLREGSFQSSID